MGNPALVDFTLNKQHFNDSFKTSFFSVKELSYEELILSLKRARTFKHREPWLVWTKVINNDAYSDLHRSLTLCEFFKRFAIHNRPIADFLADEAVAPWFQYVNLQHLASDPTPYGLDPHDFQRLTAVTIQTPFMQTVPISLTFTIDRERPVDEVEIKEFDQELNRFFTAREQTCPYVFDQIGYSNWEYAQHFV